jgi:hypothetical protein
MALRAATPTVGTGASQTAGTPGGTTSAGEYLGLWIVTDDFSASPSPSGFTVRADASISLPDGQTAKAFDKIATGSEGTGVAVTGLATGNTVMIMFALTGRNTSTPRTFTPHVASSTANNASVITISDTVTGTGAAGDDQVWVVMVDTRGVAGWAFGNSLAGWTRRVNQDDTWTPAGLYSRDNVSAGAIGTLSTTATNAGNNGGWGAVVLSIAAAAAASGSFVDDSAQRAAIRRVYSAALRVTAGGVNPLASVLATQEVPQADSGSRGWRAPPLRERGVDGLPPLTAQQATGTATADSPIPERYPALRVFGVDALAGVRATPEVPQADQTFYGRGSYPSARALGFEPLAALLTTPELPRADAPLRGWQPGPNRERGAEVPPPLLQQAPLPNADQAVPGWRPPPNRERGAEVAPPLVATQPLPNADVPLRGWQAPLNRAAGAEAPPTLVFTAIAEAHQPLTSPRWRTWRPANGEPLPAALQPPAFPPQFETWPYTRAMPPKRDWQGFTPLAAVRQTPEVPQADAPLRGWQARPQPDRGAETQPPLVFKPVGQSETGQTGWRPPPNRDRGAETPPPLVFGWAAPFDAVPPRTVRRAQVGTPDAFRSVLLASWGFELASPQPRAGRPPVGSPSDGTKAVFVAPGGMVPWGWEQSSFPSSGRRVRLWDFGNASSVPFASTEPHGPLLVVSWTNQLPTVSVSGFVSQLPVVSLVDFADQLARIQVVRFDEE